MNAANNNDTVPLWSHIELTAGTVTASTIEDSEGVRQNSAIRSAEEARLDFEIDFPVKDTVAGSH